MIRKPPATLANTKPDAALGGAPGSKEPAQTKTNNQHTKLDQAMPAPLVAAPCAESGAQSLPLVCPSRVPRLAKRKQS
eukprot:scaffold12110_cov48-Phaeocystis_antarctica.AAC.2